MLRKEVALPLALSKIGKSPLSGDRSPCGVEVTLTWEPEAGTPLTVRGVARALLLRDGEGFS